MQRRSGQSVGMVVDKLRGTFVTGIDGRRVCGRMSNQCRIPFFLLFFLPTAVSMSLASLTQIKSVACNQDRYTLMSIDSQKEEIPSILLRPTAVPTMANHGPTLLISVAAHVHQGDRRRDAPDTSPGKNACSRDSGPTVATPSALTRTLRYSLFRSMYGSVKGGGEEKKKGKKKAK